MFVGTQGDRVCLSFSFLDQCLWEHEDIVLASLFWFRNDIRSHTRRSCFLFFNWFDICFMPFSSDRSLLAYVTGVSSLLKRFGWDDQSRYFIVLVSYRCTFRTRSRRWCILCLTSTQNRSCVIFKLKFGLYSLPFLIKDRSDKLIKYWRSLYILGITWENLKSV